MCVCVCVRPVLLVWLRRLHTSLCVGKKNPNKSDSYQWLPSEFQIGDDGKVSIGSYINNLHPLQYKVKVVVCFIGTEAAARHFLFVGIRRSRLLGYSTLCVCFIVTEAAARHYIHRRTSSGHRDALCVYCCCCCCCCCCSLICCLIFNLKNTSRGSMYIAAESGGV